MKTIKLLSVMLLIVLGLSSSCSKDDNEDPAHDSRLIGRWVWSEDGYPDVAYTFFADGTFQYTDYGRYREEEQGTWTTVDNKYIKLNITVSNTSKPYVTEAEYLLKSKNELLLNFVFDSEEEEDADITWDDITPLIRQ